MVDISNVQASSKVVGGPASLTLPSFTPSKPLLPRLLEVHRSLGKTGDMATHQIIDRLDHAYAELKVWNKEQVERLLATANKGWIESGWSYLTAVANSIVTVVNIGIGAYLLYHGDKDMGAKFLLAAGISDVLHALFTRTSVGDWITDFLSQKNDAIKERYKTSVPIILTFFSLGFTMQGARTYTRFVTQENLSAILQQVQTYIQTTVQIGNSYFSIRKGIDEARMKEISGKLEFYKQNADFISRMLEFTLQESRRIKSAIKKPIMSLMQATTLASQKV